MDDFELKKIHEGLHKAIKMYNRVSLIMENNHITIEDFMMAAPFVYAYAFKDETDNDLISTLDGLQGFIKLVIQMHKDGVVLKFDMSQIKQYIDK